MLSESHWTVKARERERKGSNLGGRHENRIREVVQMYITQSEAMSKILPPGDGMNHFHSTTPMCSLLADYE